MEALPSVRAPAAHGRAVTLSVLAFALGTLLVGCAPDAVRSVDATGYNAFIRKIGTVCRPMFIGDKDVSEMIRLENAGNDGGYDYFLDITSKLYYNRITPAAFRENLTGFFGAGTYNEASFTCILNNLPAQRPNAPNSPY